MKKVNVILLLSLFFVITGGLNAYAQMCECMGQMGEGMQEDMPMMGGMKHDGKGMMEGCMGEDHHIWRHLMGLGLDEKQKDTIREIKSGLMKDMIKKKAERQIAKLELKDLLHKDPVDMKAVEAKLKQIAEIETDIQLSHLKTKETVKAKLTPEQREKLKQLTGMDMMMGGKGMKPSCGMMGGMMQHGDSGMNPPAGKEEKPPAAEQKHH
ncbi:MAG: Spy/CpxP family protein refolding chaperone [Thermodesulfovibrionales bacterium]|nr:Spy/CpxP family protein refolding chaperone [Thermodesulfovibrionales bacterium]